MNARYKAVPVRGLTLAMLVLCTAPLAGCATHPPAPSPAVIEPVATLPGVSGLAWVEDDLFLAVHDAKRSKKQKTWPRVSLVRLPHSTNEGVTWQTLEMVLPGDEKIANDLESAARLPGGRGFLFAESGPRKKVPGRIFHAVYHQGTLKIESSVPWPVEVDNVEAIEVCEVDGQPIFIYAERAEGESSTKIRWSGFSLDPLRFGPFQGVTYTGVDPVGRNVRLVSALAVDGDGFLYIASTFDPGDDGVPFRSVVRRIGKVERDENGNPRVVLEEGERVATLDGLKVEGIAVRETGKTRKCLVVGTDDENYGGIVRPLTLLP